MDVPAIYIRNSVQDRVRNAPISESAIIGSALGTVLCGVRPIAELMY